MLLSSHFSLVFLVHFCPLPPHQNGLLKPLFTVWINHSPSYICVCFAWIHEDLVRAMNYLTCSREWPCFGVSALQLKCKDRYHPAEPCASCGCVFVLEKSCLLLLPYIEELCSSQFKGVVLGGSFWIQYWIQGTGKLAKEADVGQVCG